MSKEFNITLLPGDGTGPEVVNEAVKSLKTLLNNTK
jgi:isocitrate/isopropylmalate dehydrogenase